MASGGLLKLRLLQTRGSSAMQGEGVSGVPSHPVHLLGPLTWGPPGSIFNTLTGE